jgi:hypothetical protein
MRIKSREIGYGPGETINHGKRLELKRNNQR